MGAAFAARWRSAGVELASASADSIDRADVKATKKHQVQQGVDARHVNDPYVQEAQRAGLPVARRVQADGDRRRATSCSRPGMRSSTWAPRPGSWTQVAAASGVGRRRRCIVALDLLPMEPIAGVTFVQGDFREEDGLAELERALGGRPVDLVVSDMAPNLSGIAAADQARSVHLVRTRARIRRRRICKPGGDLAGQGVSGRAGSASSCSAARRRFAKVVRRASRRRRGTESRNLLVGSGLKAACNACEPVVGILRTGVNRLSSPAAGLDVESRPRSAGAGVGCSSRRAATGRARSAI